MALLNLGPYLYDGSNTAAITILSVGCGQLLPAGRTLRVDEKCLNYTCFGLEKLSPFPIKTNSKQKPNSYQQIAGAQSIHLNASVMD